MPWPYNFNSWSNINLISHLSQFKTAVKSKSKYHSYIPHVLTDQETQRNSNEPTRSWGNNMHFVTNTENWENAWKQVSIDFTLIGWESGVRVLWANHKLETYSSSSSDGGASSISIGINLPFEGCCGAFFFFLLTLFRITLAKSLMSSFCVDCLKFKQN